MRILWLGEPRAGGGGRADQCHSSEAVLALRGAAWPAWVVWAVWAAAWPAWVVWAAAWEVWEVWAEGRLGREKEAHVPGRGTREPVTR